MRLSNADKAYQTSHTKSAQRASETGKASRAPLAKPPFPRSLSLDNLNDISTAMLPDFSKMTLAASKVSPLEPQFQMNGERRAGNRPPRPGYRSALAIPHAVATMLVAAVADSQRSDEKPDIVIRLPGPVRRIASRKPIRYVALLAILAATTRPVMAQTVHRDDTPTSLFEPERGTGGRIGGAFVLYPSIELALLHDSNVYNLPANKTADELARARAEVLIASDFSRHYFQLRAGGEARRYLDTSAENSETFHADILGRLELGGQIDVTPELGFARRVEQRGTAGDVFLTDEPVEYTHSYAGLAVARERGTLGLALRARVDRLSYDNPLSGGTPIDLSYRDADTKRVNLRASYRLAQATRVFAEAGYNAVDYRATASQLRNSDGWSLLAGVQFKPSEQVDFEAAAGYLKQDFDAPGFPSVKAVNYRLSANWLPRRNLALRAAVERTVDPSPLFNSPAVVRTEYRIGVQRSFGDRMLVEADAAHTVEDFRGIARSDNYSRIGLGARYRINRNIGAGASVGYRKQTGGIDYDGFTAGVSLRVTL